MENNFKMELIKKRERGITLIALIITIIVLLILAGVALNTLFGEYGLISNAEKAVGEYQNKVGEEQNMLNRINDYFNGVEGENPPEEIIEDGSESHPYRIEYIEDLVELSLAVWNSETEKYEGKYFLLTRDLDFENRNSYRNPDDTSYGDVNGNSIEQKLIEELTNTEESAPGNASCKIGNYEKPFTGIFLGNSKEIKNFYLKNSFVNSKTYGGLGLFGRNDGIIKDLIVSGTVLGQHEFVGDSIAGGIVGINNGEISNCMSKVKIDNNNIPGDDIAINSITGGIAGINNGVIRNCYNAEQVKGGSTGENAIGGIAGESYGEIINCYNIGELRKNHIIGWLIVAEEFLPELQTYIFPWMSIETILKFIDGGPLALNNEEKDAMYEYWCQKMEMNGYGVSEDDLEVMKKYIYCSTVEEYINGLLSLYGSGIVDAIYEDVNNDIEENLFINQLIYIFYTIGQGDITIGGIVGSGEGTIENCYNNVEAVGGIIGKVSGDITIENSGYLSGIAENGIGTVENGTVTGEASALTTMPSPLEILNAGQGEVWILDENGQPTLKD